MKRCQQCNKLVRSNALICPFCGKSTIKPPKPPRSVWYIGAIIAFILYVFFAVDRIFNSPNFSELLGSLICGGVPSFVLCWLIVTFIVWLGRKANNSVWGWIGLILGVIVLILVMFFSVVLLEKLFHGS